MSTDRPKRTVRSSPVEISCARVSIETPSARAASRRDNNRLRDVSCTVTSRHCLRSLAAADDRQRSWETDGQRTRAEPNLKETTDLPKRHRHLDDVIVDLHVEGENLFQAAARAATVPGADTEHPHLIAEIVAGHVPLKSGKTADLPPLHAAGVAAIAQFELELAEQMASRVLVDKPKLPPEPRIPVQDLWPALSEAGVRTASDPVSRGHTARATVANATGIPRRTIDRICSGAQRTVPVTTAVTLLMHLGHDEHARALEERADDWYAEKDWMPRDQYDYLEGMHRFALRAQSEPGVTPDDGQALADIRWMSAVAQHRSFLGTTPAARLDEVQELFQLAHGRKPSELSPQLRRMARRMFMAEATRATQKASGLRKGLHDRDGVISTSTVYTRTHRLRRAGKLPPRSKPITFDPEMRTGKRKPPPAR
jgi:hypothetical protein